MGTATSPSSRAEKAKIKGIAGVCLIMPDRSDRANRAPREKITPEQVFNVFDEVRGPVITSIDVSDELSCSNATANRKLDKLVKKNKVDRRAIDGNATLYWRKNS